MSGISDTTAIFNLAALCSVLLALYSLTLPHAPAGGRKAFPLKFRDLLCADAFARAQDAPFLYFLTLRHADPIPLGTYYAYTASYLADAGVRMSAPP